MLTQLTPKAVEALAVLTRHPRWKDLRELIENEIAQGYERLLGASDQRTVGEAQGRIKSLKELLAAADTAEKTLAKQGKTPGLG